MALDMSSVMSAIKRYNVQYDPLQASGYFQRLAKEGYGQQGLRDMLLPRVQNIQNEYMNRRGTFLGETGRRGLYDSSIKEQGLAGLIGEREGAMGTAQANVWKENQRVMLEGQKVLENLRRFNAQNQFQSETFNRQQDLQLKMHTDNLQLQRQMLEEQQRQARRQMWGNIGTSAGGNLLALAMM